MADRLNWTLSREMGRESKRGITEQEGQPKQRDQETSIAKMAELYRDQAGGQEDEAQVLGGRGFQVSLRPNNHLRLHPPWI